MKYRLLKFIIAVLALVVIGLLTAPWYISDPDIEKAIAKDLTFVAAGLIVLAAIGFLVNMTDTKIHEDQAAASGKTDSPFSDNSLFDAKIRAMHEREERHACLPGRSRLQDPDFSDGPGSEGARSG